MYKKYQNQQFNLYRKAFTYFQQNPSALIEAERFIAKEILHFIDLKKPEIERDYNEASYLNPFWRNYPPLDRGKDPRHDQCPWIEVGEQVFGSKLSRYFASNFTVKDSGLPSGADDRYIISSERIRGILGITDSIWVFIDIKSVGPRDDFPHAVMSPYQVSGSGEWLAPDNGVSNRVMVATGQRARHDFACSLPPIYILSDGTIAPLVTFVIKPIYKMLSGNNEGQPLSRIKVASIPNGILLTQSPNYLSLYPGLLFPGKDDKKKDPRKLRARVSFDILEKIDKWRVAEVVV